MMRRLHAAIIMAWIGACIAGLIVVEAARCVRASGKQRAKSRRAKVLPRTPGHAGAETPRKPISARK